MVFYRGPEGKAAALEDFCPHRGAPLSLGRVVEGKLVCGYHGLEMGCDGKTIAMPGQRVRGFPPIRSFPVIEQHGFVWVWPGDAAQAERRPAAASAMGRQPGVGLWRRAVPHAMRLPADDRQPDGPDARDLRACDQHRPEGDRRGAAQRPAVEGDSVVTSRFMHNIMAPPFWRMALRGHDLPDDMPVDRWQICRFTPAEPRDDRSRRRARRQGRLRRAQGPQGLRHRGRLHHARKPRPRSGTSGAWRATSIRTTRR